MFQLSIPLLSGDLTAQFFFLSLYSPTQVLLVSLTPPLALCSGKAWLLRFFSCSKNSQMPQGKVPVEHQLTFMKFSSFLSNLDCFHCCCFSKTLLLLSSYLFIWYFFPKFSSFRPMAFCRLPHLTYRSKHSKTMPFYKINHPQGFCPLTEGVWGVLKALKAD